MDNHNNKSVDSTWTQHDRSMFLHAVANGPDDIAGRWDEMANAIPGKTPEEVKVYYEAVEHDLLEIEAGRVELPNYSDDIGDEFVVTVKKEDEAVGNLDSEVLAMGDGTKRVEKERKKATPWTEEEHRRFLQGLKVYGKGDWRSISRIMVVTRTATQVASHAQKYFLRQASLKEDNNKEENKKKKKRRRCSIHDITTADVPVVEDTQPSSSTPPTSSLNGSQGRGVPTPTPTPSSPHEGQFNGIGSQGREQSSLKLWSGIQGVTTTVTTMVVHTQPISSTPPPATSFYGGSNGRAVPTTIATSSSHYFCGGQGRGGQPPTNFYGGQGGGAPQPLNSFYGGQGRGVPTLPATNFFGEQGRAPPRYGFIKNLAPTHVKDYSLDEDFSFKTSYFSETNL
ncbi:putative transcription factor MYB-related family [Helianthus annuus]|uniref:Transcription factor MYB-related family n=1 Tax=Helianthus annuus TaxID=4232 RepID=A0A9K3H1T7_HELAN|nr:putative transcription factor MYB-related family [Helianthus annuus]KAJ0471805.1 putative transcription factor MYB/SANT family [Helianthus annuus]KAJ0647416.1 putative transcription factor MYB/SANT family [Helianthus annuus]